jgi:hypothetical protein
VVRESCVALKGADIDLRSTCGTTKRRSENLVQANINIISSINIQCEVVDWIRPVFVLLGLTAGNGGKLDELERIWKEGVCGLIEVLSRNSPLGLKKNVKNLKITGSPA